MKFRPFIYGTRGLYLFVAQLLVLWLKQRAGSDVSLPVYLLFWQSSSPRKSFAPGRPTS